MVGFQAANSMLPACLPATMLCASSLSKPFMLACKHMVLQSSALMVVVLAALQQLQKLVFDTRCTITLSTLCCYSEYLQICSGTQMYCNRNCVLCAGVCVFLQVENACAAAAGQIAIQAILPEQDLVLACCSLLQGCFECGVYIELPQSLYIYMYIHTLYVHLRQYGQLYVLECCSLHLFKLAMS